MGLFDVLGDMARDKIDSFKEDPAGNIERTVTRSINKFNDECEKKRSEIIRTGEKKARTFKITLGNGEVGYVYKKANGDIAITSIRAKCR